MKYNTNPKNKYILSGLTLKNLPIWYYIRWQRKQHKSHEVETLQTTHANQKAIKLEAKNAINNQNGLPTWVYLKQFFEIVKENINRNY